MAETRPPLAGYRVLEFSQFVAAPYCGMLLADLGAEVIKVEPPAPGEPGRWLGSTAYWGDDAAQFLMLNRNKRSLALDLNRAEARAIVQELALRADVLLENYRPGILQRWGLDYEGLAPDNPALVYCSISMFGSKGPYAGRPGIDPLVQAMGGFMALNGEPGRPPVMANAPIGDVFGAMNAVYGVLAALLARARAGQGQYVEISLLDAQIAALSPRLGDFFAMGRQPPPSGSANPLLAPYELFETAEGYLYVATLHDKFWRVLCEALGLTDLAEDSRYARNAGRVERREELHELLAPIFRQRPAQDWTETLGEAGFLCGPVYDFAQIVNDPQVVAEELIVTLPHPVAGSVPNVGSVARLSRTPPRLETAAPLLGQHNAEILAELGYNQDRIGELIAEGVVGAPRDGPKG